MTLKVPAQLLPAAARIAVPWKNGGGLTREVLAAPDGAALGDFDWRVSTAEVRSAGPFSIFPGVQRTLCVLEGALALEVEGMRPVRLAQDSAPYVFSGDAAAHAHPGAEGVVDLNVMTRRGRFGAQVAAVQFMTPVTRDSGPALTLVFARTPVTVTTPDAEWRLARWDTLKLTEATPCTLTAPGGQGSCYFIDITFERRGYAAGAGLHAQRA